MAEAVQDWIEGVGTKVAYIEKASVWEHSYVERFKGKLRDELLNGEVLDTIREVQVLIEGWRRHDNQVRPQSALGYRPPAPAVGSRGPHRAGARCGPRRPVRPRDATCVARPAAGRRG